MAFSALIYATLRLRLPTALHKINRFDELVITKEANGGKCANPTTRWSKSRNIIHLQVFGIVCAGDDAARTLKSVQAKVAFIRAKNISL